MNFKERIAEILGIKGSNDVWKTHPKIYKRQGIIKPEVVESTPIVFRQDKYIIVFQRRKSQARGESVAVLSFEDGSTIQNFRWRFGLGCALVEHKTIHVFGSSEWDRTNHIEKARLVYDSDNESFTLQDSLPIWHASSDQSIYNSSVCTHPGGYVLAYEVREPSTVNFSVRFLKSKDLIKWETIGSIFHPDIYAACPTIRYHEGWFYILYLRHEFVHKRRMGYVMSIARTQDFVNFHDFLGNGKYNRFTQVLSPFGSDIEGINNSDVDLVEHNGITYFIYADGDQKTWANLRIAVYLGKLSEFFAEYWP